MIYLSFWNCEKDKEKAEQQKATEEVEGAMDTKESTENENWRKHSYEEVSSPVPSSGDGDSYPPDIKREYFTGYHPSNRSEKI